MLLGANPDDPSGLISHAAPLLQACFIDSICMSGWAAWFALDCHVSTTPAKPSRDEYDGVRGLAKRGGTGQRQRKERKKKQRLVFRAPFPDRCSRHERSCSACLVPGINEGTNRSARSLRQTAMFARGRRFDVRPSKATPEQVPCRHRRSSLPYGKMACDGTLQRPGSC
ncbi:hypothetical protein LZ32DRAFT_55840 [Colletotrichum eremochloae]|nr:hypothetical protein LZ32DRAFT_55840 [Colletotrichum eremochloae]